MMFMVVETFRNQDAKAVYRSQNVRFFLRSDFVALVTSAIGAALPDNSTTAKSHIL
jgi:hypothetical protein